MTGSLATQKMFESRFSAWQRIKTVQSHTTQIMHIRTCILTTGCGSGRKSRDDKIRRHTYAISCQKNIARLIDKGSRVRIVVVDLSRPSISTVGHVIVLDLRRAKVGM